MYFAKMHGLGNDFIVLDNRDNSITDLKKLAVKVCDRHFGIGADGILIIEKSSIADIKMSIINSDGSTAEMCGNGIRCFSKFVYEKKIINKEVINIETLAGVMKAELKVEGSKVFDIRINMGSPRRDKDSIPFRGNGNNLNYNIEINEKRYSASTILLGVPHTIVYVDRIDENEVIETGRKIENLSFFPSKTNVNFVNVIDKDRIEVRTWERGAGYTLACGTGACASVVASYLSGKTNNKVEVMLYGGKLFVEYIDGSVFMTGPAEFICEGKINI